MIAQWLVQTYASVVRIDKYLEEDEVPERVSWLSGARTSTPGSAFDERIGCENATFKWSLPDDPAKTPEKKPVPKIPLFTKVKNVLLFWKNPTTAPVPDEETPEDEEPEFELRDITVTFQRGQLNLVSGPTGSGKSSCVCPALSVMRGADFACSAGRITGRDESYSWRGLLAENRHPCGLCNWPQGGR